MKKNLLSVTKNNIECAFCKEKNCSFRYEPNHSLSIEGIRVYCTKLVLKKGGKVLRKKIYG